jgi:hypothetical protein
VHGFAAAGERESYYSFSAGFGSSIDLYGASDDFVIGSAMEAQFTNTRGGLSGKAHGWPERPASNGTRGIQIAGAGRRIEGRTKLVFGRFIDSECRLQRIVRERSREVIDVDMGAVQNARGALRFTCLQLSQSLAQAHSIELRDGKRADTTFVATDAARDPGTALANGFGHGAIDDLYQFGVVCHAVDCPFRTVLT